MDTKSEEDFVYGMVDMAKFIEIWGADYIFKELKKFDTLAFNSCLRHFDEHLHASHKVAALLRSF